MLTPLDCQAKWTYPVHFHPLRSMDMFSLESNVIRRSISLLRIASFYTEHIHKCLVCLGSLNTYAVVEIKTAKDTGF